ncbi:MAG TPA: glycosyltransferase family 4 protein [Thermoanaerobaculia bacterium]|nr:glycosyltransferase family 4 protein [Thermoanaerobaculia bacterium]
MVERSHLRTAVFSIISPNYRHFARVLMQSLRTHQPEWERYVLLVGDDGKAIREELFETVSLDALPLPGRLQFCFRYTILELNTAAKPWMFEHLFARGYDRVVYLDPDIRLYSALFEVAESDAFLVLTPHLTGPIGGDDHPSERTILQAGTYNLGFLAVSRRPSLSTFLAWWQEKLEFQCVVDVANGIFVDQKWIDLTPGFFDGVHILRHDGYNVAYWNLGQRTVRGDGSSATVNGQPLRFFHFSGFDPSDARMASRHDFALRVTEVGDARKLMSDYDAAIRAAGYESFRNARYAFGFFSDGTPIPDAARVAYRNSPALQTAAGEDPFQHPELFRHQPRQRRRRGARLSRVAAAAYTSLSRLRPVVALFPPPVRKAAREFLLGRRETVSPPPRPRGALPPGLNIVGNVSHDTGVGESARLCRNACEAAGIAYHMLDAGSDDVQHAMYRTSIFHVNADQLPEVHTRLPHVFDASAYNIGCWHWELPELPDVYARSAAPLDEIWAPSAFIQEAVSAKVSIPVIHMPHGLEVTEIETCSPEELGVPRGRFTFLCMFDFASVMERKNPLGAIEAFRRALPAGAPAALLIKTSRADQYRRDYARLANQIRGIPNVYLSDRVMSRARVNGLLAACDAVVSLHRSEGFGLILAEAMYLGKPVVATGWSGNMDFMNAGNSCPVAYEVVTLDHAYGPYAAGQQWAEPDVDDAARLMRRIFDDAEFRSKIGACARDTIRSQFSPAAAGRRYRERLAAVGQLVR